VNIGIKMEKLIELLNEYDWTPTEWKQIWDKIYFDWLGWNSELHELIIISKYYGFIKWLVENDKIWINKNSDRSAMIDLMRAEVKEWTDVFEWTKKYEWYIMILSIQDNPIEFICEILQQKSK